MSYVLTRVRRRHPNTAEFTNKVKCQYFNRTQQAQIIRIANIPHEFFERTVLPGEKLCFDAYPHAELEIHTYEIASATLTEKIICERLAVHTAFQKTILYALYK